MIFKNWAKQIIQTMSVISFALFLLSCASYQQKVQVARDDIEFGNYDQAIEKLKPLALKEGDDQLVYLLDYGVALQLAGRYQESNEAFLLADKLTEVKDYHSLSRIGGSLALNEGMVQYKGEDYEKILINAYLAINYLMLGNLDDALVETRRLNDKIKKYRTDAKLDYELNPFAIYLSAIIWEADRKWDDAFIAYEDAYKIDANIELLPEDLIRSSRAAQRIDANEKWVKAFPNVKIRPEWKNKDYGELILIYQQGWAPRKHPRPENFRFPKLYHQSSYTRQARLKIEGVGTVDSQPVFNVEKVAIKTLDDAYATLVAKRIAGLVVKDQIAQKLEENNKLLGQLAWIAMNVADQADLRQWSTLPESFQVARILLPAGTYKVSVSGLNDSGFPSGSGAPEQEVKINKQKKTFLNWRSFR